MPSKPPSDLQNTARRRFLIHCSQAAAGFLIPLPANPSPPSDFHLHPRYREPKTSLDTALIQLEPGHDTFTSEVFHDRVSVILNNWSQSLLASPRNSSELGKSLAQNFRGAPWTPIASQPLRAAPTLDIRRVRFVIEPSLAPTAFVGSLETTFAPFSKFLTADFQITNITAQTTRIYYELVGTGEGFYREQRTGYWLLDWDDQDHLKTWRMQDETRVRSARPFFQEITSQAFSHNPAYAAQMLRGADDWRSTLDGACGIDIYGHNGVSVGDLYGDGLDDIYICQPAGLPNRLYRNRGDGTFDDITELSGLGLLDNTACALIADFDNDGRQDIVVVRASGPLLFLNQGNGKFRLQPDAFHFATPPQGTFTGAAAADYNRDGHLDIYFCLYVFYQGADQYKYPTPYFAAENGPPNFLMHNNGDGTFTDVTSKTGLDRNNTRFSFCAAWSDYNSDGWPDLYVVNDFGRKNLYRNNGNGTFTDVAAEAGVEDVGAGMSVGWFDYNNDGAQDLYVANMWTAAGERLSDSASFQQTAPAEAQALYRKHAMGNSLYRNQHPSTSAAMARPAVSPVRWAAWWDAWWGRRFRLPSSAAPRPVFRQCKPCRSKLEFLSPGSFRNPDWGPVALKRTTCLLAEPSCHFHEWCRVPGILISFRNPRHPDLRKAALFRRLAVRSVIRRKPRQPGSFRNPRPYALRNAASFRGPSVRSVIRRKPGQPSSFRNPPAPPSSFRNFTLLPVPATLPPFSNATTTSQTANGRWSWSSDAWDFDHDGFADIYIANGMISGQTRPDLNSFFWRQVVAKSPNTAASSLEYEQGWNAVNELIRQGYSWSGFERNILYANHRDGTFSDISGALGLDFQEDSRAFALADFDGDGRQEILIKNRNTPQLRLLRNIHPNLPPSISFRLKGVKSNRDAIGASITLGSQTKFLQAGSGFLSQHSKDLFFGLGESKGNLSATIKWPSGLTQHLDNLPPNHLIQVTEGSPPTMRRAASKVGTPNPQPASPIQSLSETWLLSPIPAPTKPAGSLLTIDEHQDQDIAAIYNLLFRYIFDHHQDLPIPTSFLIDNQGQIVKIYQGPVDSKKVQSDLQTIPRTATERLAKALPFPGIATTYTYGRNYLSLGSVFFQRGYPETSETFFRAALQDDPNSAEALYGLGSVYLNQQKNNQARDFFERASQLKSTYPETGPNAWNNLGLLATRAGDPAKAVGYFQQALQLDPNHFIALENLGSAYRQLKRFPEARQTLERALSIKPDDPEANYSLGMVFAQTDDTDQAYSHLQKALELRPAYPEALNNLGILYLRTHRRDDAVAAFEKCIQVAPAFDQSYLNLARVYAIEGSLEKARTVLQALLNRHPGHEMAQQALDQLTQR